MYCHYIFLNKILSLSWHKMLIDKSCLDIFFVSVCRRLSSNPLDVPGVVPSSSRNSLVVDSGCASGSFASISTGPPNFPTWESVFSHKGNELLDSKVIQIWRHSFGVLFGGVLGVRKRMLKTEIFSKNQILSLVRETTGKRKRNTSPLA